MTLRDVGRLFLDAGQKFLDDKATRLAAALAYYTALSLSPLHLLIISIAGFGFGAEAARGEIQSQIHDTVGEEGAQAIEAMLANSRKDGSGILAAAIGLGTLLVGATGVFAQLQDALNSIWKIPPALEQKKGGILRILRERLLSFSLVCGMAFLLLVSLAISASVDAISNFVGDWLPNWVTPIAILNLVLSYVLTTALIALIFKILPELKMSWKDVWLGAAITALLFLLGKSLIVMYLGRSAMGSAFGAAGAFVVLLVWIYYSSLLLLLGAELTYLYAKRFGSGLEAPDGTPLKDVKSEAEIVRQAVESGTA